MYCIGIGSKRPELFNYGRTAKVRSFVKLSVKLPRYDSYMDTFRYATLLLTPNVSKYPRMFINGNIISTYMSFTEH